MNSLDTEKASFKGNPRSADEVVEIAVLLESPLLECLEAAARAQGISAGSLVRSLLRDFLCYPDSNAHKFARQKDSRTATLC